MDDFVTIKSANDATRLTFGNAAAGSFTTTLESARFSGRVEVSTYISGSPSRLFEEIAREWRGWDGEKDWAALDDELRLTASSDHTGHTTLVVVMHDHDSPENWRLEAKLVLEAGQLEDLARAVRKVFRSAPPPDWAGLS